MLGEYEAQLVRVSAQRRYSDENTEVTLSAARMQNSTIFTWLNNQETRYTLLANVDFQDE